MFSPYIALLHFRCTLGIPRAPINFKNIGKLVGPEAARYVEKIKKKLQYKLPWLTSDEIIRRQQKYHVVKLHELMVGGLFQVAQEVRSIIRVDKLANRGWSWHGQFIVDNEMRLDLIVKTFTKCFKLTNKGKYDDACILKKRLGEKFLRNGEPWLAIYIFHSCLIYSQKMQLRKEEVQAELHCLLAFLEKPKNERLLTRQNIGKILESSIVHLTMCRVLSQIHPGWRIGPHLIKVKVATALNVHGLGNEIVQVEGNSASLCTIAALLEHDLLIGLADATLKAHHHNASADEYFTANLYAGEALRLAFEVRHPVAISSAILRCGLLQRHCHKLDEALALFTQLVNYSEMHEDLSTKAIGLQYIGKCWIDKHEVVEGLEYFIQEKELAKQEEMIELEADATKEIGIALLEEGQLWESEDAFYESYAKFNETELTAQQEEVLVFASIAAGQQLWSRLTGLARSEKLESVLSIISWKDARKPLPPVAFTEYNLLDGINDLYNASKKPSRRVRNRGTKYEPKYHADGKYEEFQNYHQKKGHHRLQSPSEETKQDDVGHAKEIKVNKEEADKARIHARMSTAVKRRETHFQPLH